MNESQKLPVGVGTYLECATCHITKTDDELLAKFAGDYEAPIIADKRKVGYWVLACPDQLVCGESLQEVQAAGFSFGFLLLLNYAVEHGCDWVLLDPDANRIPSLPVYTW